MYESYPFEEVCRAFVAISDADTENEVTKAFADGMRALDEIAKNAYERIQNEHIQEAISDRHDDAVRAAGGD